MLYEFSFISMSSFFTFDFLHSIGAKTLFNAHSPFQFSSPFYMHLTYFKYIFFQHIIMLYEFSFISMSSFSICLGKEDIFR